jgi:NTE family protein
MILRQRLAGRRFGCVLSAGFFGFYGHAGFIDGLLGEGLKPAAWAGTSAGGMVAALAASGVERAKVCDAILDVKRADFWDPDPLGIAVDFLGSGHRAGGLLKGRKFHGLLERHLPVKRFEDCVTPLLVAVTNLTRQTTEVIAEGDLPSAVLATCAYPGLFAPVKRDGALLWDGGIVDKAPVLALADHAIGKGLDALLVHFLPSSDAPAGPRGAFAYASGVAGGMAASRKDHFRLQLAVLEARGVEVYVITSRLPPVRPNSMGRGKDAMDAGRASVLAALGEEPSSWQGSD